MAPRKAMMSNLIKALIENERIETTDPKAKELRRYAERAIGWAGSVGTLIDSPKADAEDKARIVHAMRMAARLVKHKPALLKLFHDIGPRIAGRAGGYTRIMKLRTRHGDAAPISIIEFVDRIVPKKVETPAPGGQGKGGKGASAEAAGETAAPKKRSSKKEAAGSAETGSETP